MIIPLAVILAVAFLAYANGANDNFKGVASLFGSGVCNFRTALTWATVTTMAGSIAALFLASALLKNFSGKGLVPEALSVSPAFVLAVAIGAGGTVLLATRFGFPISTTHGLTGALVGAGMMADSAGVNYAVLGKTFLMPLLLSPFLALVVGGLIYLLFKGGRKALGVTEETCVCVGEEWVPVHNSNGSAVAKSSVTLAVDETAACERRYHGRVLGLEVKTLVDQLHFLSAGAVSFARGLNDTPKIAALLLVAGSLSIPWSLAIVGVIMALGGLLQSKRVATTMSHKLTDMNPGQGLAANVSTALLVTTASFHGLPVSTTHVSVGGLLGMGTVTGQAKWKTVIPVLASWVITLPVAIIFAALAYYLFNFIQS
ncbi:anion permease [Verrucomicrobiaceae bacterium R5-34]|uniref:Phosphate transporter n=1 Tax=Oceaniferula flava TaxID=2800421 RepID=A0AAE2S9G2_9BACT|nr:anion permease [Oceaniferula flavus]MBK1829455.1 anion permease [Verrucomicrobiaceae bacterium R5-34]MBK1853681.1 anion permease [Oceaniferula flavus]MBM1134987.1 anion permease [Oceaniferula flavus]